MQNKQSMSMSTIDGPEFINLRPVDVNPLMSLCDIKVLYVGANRNGSFITKEVATEMAKTLRGAPIVGWYSEDKEDFVDHGDRVTIDGEGIHFKTLTKPYGFVSPDADIWFQKFDEGVDALGQKVEREYLMTQGYLWTGQYEEAQKALGRPVSMELNEETLDGSWAEDSKSGMEFFIINDAVFQNICILGQDVEPCFENASITKASAHYSLDENFTKTLYSMMQDLQLVLGQGGKDKTMVNKTEKLQDGGDISIEEKMPDTYTKQTEEVVETEESFVDLKEYEALKAQNETLQARITELEKQNQSLTDFKKQVESEKKDALIDSFYMLSDEDKQDVIQHKDEYSLDDIESKLSVICVRKRVSFNTTETKTEEKPAVTYNLNEESDNSVPDWIAALRNTKKNKDI
ncbi:MAG: hypothetical protein LUC37_02125 [Prevotella sp.]|nr:hypothetical protein [Prevotella sp.]